MARKPDSVYCPICGAQIDNALTNSGSDPRPGDLMVCTTCTKPSRYTNEGHLQRMTKEDINQLPANAKALVMACMMQTAEDRVKGN